MIFQVVFGILLTIVRGDAEISHPLMSMFSSDSKSMALMQEQGGFTGRRLSVPSNLCTEETGPKFWEAALPKLTSDVCKQFAEESESWNPANGGTCECIAEVFAHAEDLLNSMLDCYMEMGHGNYQNLKDYVHNDRVQCESKCDMGAVVEALESSPFADLLQACPTDRDMTEDEQCECSTKFMANRAELRDMPEMHCTVTVDGHVPRLGSLVDDWVPSTYSKCMWRHPEVHMCDDKDAEDFFNLVAVRLHDAGKGGVCDQFIADRSGWNPEDENTCECLGAVMEFASDLVNTETLCFLEKDEGVVMARDQLHTDNQVCHNKCEDKREEMLAAMSHPRLDVIGADLRAKCPWFDGVDMNDEQHCECAQGLIDYRSDLEMTDAFKCVVKIEERWGPLLYDYAPSAVRECARKNPKDHMCGEETGTKFWEVAKPRLEGLDNPEVCDQFIAEPGAWDPSKDETCACANAVADRAGDLVQTHLACFFRRENPDGLKFMADSFWEDRHFCTRTCSAKLDEMVEQLAPETSEEGARILNACPALRGEEMPEPCECFATITESKEFLRGLDAFDCAMKEGDKIFWNLLDEYIPMKLGQCSDRPHGGDHDPSKCIENGKPDNDCCSVAGDATCSDGFVMKMSDKSCCPDCDWNPMYYECFPPVDPTLPAPGRPTVLPIVKPGPDHDPSKCVENGGPDNDCCAVAGSATCADGFVMKMSDKSCCPDCDWDPMYYECFPPVDPTRPTVLPIVKPGPEHDPSKCVENGEPDNDCCAVAGSAKCAEGFVITWSERTCCPDCDWNPVYYTCTATELPAPGPTTELPAPITTPGPRHDASKCRERGEHDNDCCAHPAQASCADGFILQQSDRQCCPHCAVNRGFEAKFYQCLTPAETTPRSTPGPEEDRIIPAEEAREIIREFEGEVKRLANLLHINLNDLSKDDRRRLMSLLDEPVEA